MCSYPSTAVQQASAVWGNKNRDFGAENFGRYQLDLSHSGGCRIIMALNKLWNTFLHRITTLWFSKWVRFYHDRTFLKQSQSAEQDTDRENQPTCAKMIETGFEMFFFSCVVICSHGGGGNCLFLAPGTQCTTCGHKTLQVCSRDKNLKAEFEDGSCPAHEYWVMMWRLSSLRMGQNMTTLTGVTAAVIPSQHGAWLRSVAVYVLIECSVYSYV